MGKIPVVRFYFSSWGQEKKDDVKSVKLIKEDKGKFNNKNNDDFLRTLKFYFENNTSFPWIANNLIGIFLQYIIYKTIITFFSNVFYDLFQRKAGGTRHVPTRNGSKIIVFAVYKKVPCSLFYFFRFICSLCSLLYLKWVFDEEFCSSFLP